MTVTLRCCVDDYDYDCLFEIFSLSFTLTKDSPELVVVVATGSSVVSPGYVVVGDADAVVSPGYVVVGDADAVVSPGYVVVSGAVVVATVVVRS